MLNKRIKSLLVAGLLVFSMGFAKVDSFAAEPLMSEITDIEFVKGEEQKVVTLQHGYITVTMNKNADGKYDIVVKWDKTVLDVVKVESIFETNSLFSSLNSCYSHTDDGQYITIVIKDANIGPDAFGSPNYGELTKVNVYFNLVDSDKDGAPDFKDDTPKPEEPEEPKDPNVKDPETGDASMIAVVGIAVASAVGLYAVNKKDDEE
jgi:hypothetical protein